MEIASFWDERKLLVFVALIIVASAFMLLEVAAARRGERSVPDQLVTTVFAPLQRAVTGVAGVVVTGVENLVRAPSLSAQNSVLSRKVSELSSANERLKAKALENKQLHRLLGLQQSLPIAGVAANVVGYLPESARREISIDRGFRDGVQRDSVVVTADGLVGHVIDAGAHNAHVLLIIDPTSNVPAYLRATRAWGIATGTWRHVRMKYIGQDVKVRAGDTVITGRGEIYPPDIPIGMVREIDRSDNKLYQTAVLQPSVNFDALTQVVVLRR